MKRVMNIWLFALTWLCIVACACQKPAAEVGEGGKNDNVVVKTKINRKDVLDNPLNGWVMYASRSADASYWDKKVYVSELGKDVKVIDYASACYIRTSWSSLNPADGEYVWNNPSSRLCQLIRGAQERGKPIAFRVVVDGRDQGANTPQFVYDAGAEYWLADSKYPDRKTPLAIDPIFRRYYEKFVEAFAKEFNDPEKTAFIDAYGLGKWGEGHNVVYEIGNPVNDMTAEYKAETMKWITSLYARYFTKIPLVINYHRHIGHPVSEGAAAQPDSETVLAIAINNGYCLRSDAIGMNNSSWGYGNWERGYARTWNYKRPILMEGGWIVGQHSYWGDDKGYRKDHPEDVRQGEFESSAEAKVNMMDFRAGDETESWFETSFSLVQRFITEGGYRLYPETVSLPQMVTKGTKVTVEHRWRNMGWGYFPNNLPQWNYKYKVALALLDKNGKVEGLYIDQNCEPSEWTTSSGYNYSFKADVEVPAGNYTWAIAMVDTSRDNVPAIKLALNNEKTADGWVKLMEVVVK